MGVPWREIFGNEHPVEVEIGPERGTFLLATAANHPERNYFGIERSATRTRAFEATLARRRLPNVRVVNADATCVLRTLIGPCSVSAYHIYFPDPWWKRRHHRRRLITPEFAALLARTLARGGTIYLVTDVRETFDLAVEGLRSIPLLVQDLRVSPRPVRTAFEQKAINRGSPIYAISFRKVEERVGDYPVSIALESP